VQKAVLVSDEQPFDRAVYTGCIGHQELRVADVRGEIEDDGRRERRIRANRVELAGGANLVRRETKRRVRRTSTTPVAM
jgi:hypothetical protein